MTDKATTTTIRNHYPFTLEAGLDDDGNVLTIPLRIARMDDKQGMAFGEQWKRQMNRDSELKIYRKYEGDERATRTVIEGDTTIEVFIVDDAEIRRRRLQEMTDEQQVAFAALEASERSDEYDFLVDSVKKYVRVSPEQRVMFEAADGTTREAVTGEDLLQAIGGHHQQLRQITRAIFAENNLTAREKKLWRNAASTPAAAPTPQTMTDEAVGV